VVVNALCIGGVGPWCGIDCNGATVEFVSGEVAQELEKLISPWWDPITSIRADLEERDRKCLDSSGLAQADLVGMVEEVLPQAFITELT
jgi:hypothetical protein